MVGVYGLLTTKSDIPSPFISPLPLTGRAILVGFSPSITKPFTPFSVVSFIGFGKPLVLPKTIYGSN